MKHIKLFENWAEELQVPEYLRKDWKPPKGTQTKFNNRIQNELKKDECDLENECKTYLNIQHFYELDGLLREDGYIKVSLSQAKSKYRLQDLEGIPEISHSLYLWRTEIKSLKGLENRVMTGWLQIFHSNLENFKYCPTFEQCNIFYCPLLSYWGMKGEEEQTYVGNTMCSPETYKKDLMLQEQLDSVEFHADTFCNFDAKLKNTNYTNGFNFNPWHQCYYDPNNVENYDFLFNPFWLASEKFREKAQTMITDINLGKLSKEELW